jgi:hypothetical protein
LNLVSTSIPKIRKRMSYSLSTSQVYDDFWSSIFLFEKLANYLFYRVHTQPIASVDEWVPSNELRHKWLIVVRLIAKIKFGYAPLGHDAAIVGLISMLVQCL